MPAIRAVMIYRNEDSAATKLLLFVLITMISITSKFLSTKMKGYYYRIVFMVFCRFNFDFGTQSRNENGRAKNKNKKSKAGLNFFFSFQSDFLLSALLMSNTLSMLFVSNRIHTKVSASSTSSASSSAPIAEIPLDRLDDHKNSLLDSGEKEGIRSSSNSQPNENEDEKGAVVTSQEEEEAEYLPQHVHFLKPTLKYRYKLHYFVYYFLIS